MQFLTRVFLENSGRFANIPEPPALPLVNALSAYYNKSVIIFSDRIRRAAHAPEAGRESKLEVLD